MRKKFYVKSTFSFKYESGELSKGLPAYENIDVFALADETDENIYQVYIKNRDNNSLILESQFMKITDVKMREITFSGLNKEDTGNRWGIDYSNYSIQFIMSAAFGLTESFGTAILQIKDKKLALVYQ